MKIHTKITLALSVLCAGFAATFLFGNLSIDLLVAQADIIEAPIEYSLSGLPWFKILMVSIGALMLILFFQLGKIHDLVEDVTGKRGLDWQKITGRILLPFVILFLGAIVYEFIVERHLFVTTSASAHGNKIDNMMLITFVIIAIVFVITQFLLFFFMYKYRDKEGAKAHYYAHNNKLELFWTAIPSIVLTILVLRGYSVWSSITDNFDKPAQEIEVTAYQFNWAARYPGVDKKLGKYNFNFISGTNVVGVASKKKIDDLKIELNSKRNIKKELITKLPERLEVVNAKLLNLDPRSYPKKYKSLKTESEDIISGAAKADLNKDISRVETQLTRIDRHYKNDKMWNSDYKDDIMSSEIVCVKNKPVRLILRSRDVIHSAYSPPFRMQMNCVPGMETKFRFTPTVSTKEMRIIRKKKNDKYGDTPFEDYFLYCNKICGGSHFNMAIKITVFDTQAELNAWMSKQKPSFN